MATEEKSVIQTVKDFLKCSDIVEKKNDDVLIALRDKNFPESFINEMRYAIHNYNSAVDGVSRFTCKCQLSKILPKSLLVSMFTFTNKVTAKYPDENSLMGDAMDLLS